jgi:hypothetical protein
MINKFHSFIFFSFFSCFCRFNDYIDLKQGEKENFPLSLTTDRPEKKVKKKVKKAKKPLDFPKSVDILYVG